MQLVRESPASSRRVGCANLMNIYHSLQFFSLPQVSHPYSNSHANVHAVSILVSKTSCHMFFPINALSLATNHI